MIDAIHTGALADAPTQLDPVFGLEMVTRVPNVPDEVLVPRDTWADKDAYDGTARKLADLFKENFERYGELAATGVKEAGPQ
jgi:phosphoenolpyruvate carboxykinase (ATP)